jgi:hypothetical protein
MRVMEKYATLHRFRQSRLKYELEARKEKILSVVSYDVIVMSCSTGCIVPVTFLFSSSNYTHPPQSLIRMKQNKVVK